MKRMGALAYFHCTLIPLLRGHQADVSIPHTHFALHVEVQNINKILRKGTEKKMYVIFEVFSQTLFLFVLGPFCVHSARFQPHQQRYFVSRLGWLLYASTQS